MILACGMPSGKIGSQIIEEINEHFLHFVKALIQVLLAELVEKRIDYAYLGYVFIGQVAQNREDHIIWQVTDE